jgi:RNA-binding protein 39
LEPIFEAFGELESVEVHRDNATGQSKGFGFVQFKKKEEGEMAMAALDGYDIAGRNIRVGLANPTDAPGSKNPRAQQQQQRPMQQQQHHSLIPGMLPGMLPGMAPGALLGAVPPMQPAVAPALPQLPVLSVAQLTPSPFLLISNMFDPATETDPEWALDLDEDVRDETAKYGRLAHLHVDKDSSQGRVWMRFELQDAAQQAQKALHGRWFAGRQLTAEFVTENDYVQRFPQSNPAAPTDAPAPAPAGEPAAPSDDATTAAAPSS